jgi:glycosyltransferase involved in cell wall biosynthesis
VKVLHVITRLNQGGTARWLEKLSRGLAAADWESVVVVGEVGQNELEDGCFQELHALRVKSLGKEKGLVDDIRSFFILRKIIRDQKPDVLNTHTSKAGVIGRLAANSIFGSRPRVIHTYHGHLLYGYFSKPLTKIIVLVEKCMSYLTDQFISAGKTVRDELIQSGIGVISDYSIINPGVDSPVEFDPIIRNRFGISKDAIVVGWMGRFEKVKSPQRVLDLANQFPSIIFLMAGTGKLFSEIQSKAPANLLLPGWSDANEIWSASDIALLTSENEALPIVLIEAGLAGLPAVAENVGAVAEVISDKKTGFLCNSLEERVQAITLLIEDIQLRHQMGSNARIHCLTHFSPQKFIDDHIGVYLSVVRK